MGELKYWPTMLYTAPSTKDDIKVISIALFPPSPVPPQLSQPCEVYTRTQLGDIVVHNTFPTHKGLNNAIEDALMDEPRVWVLCAPPHAGKSTAVSHVLHNLHQQGKVNVLELEGSSFNKFILKRGGDKYLGLDDWLQHAMGCAKPFSIGRNSILAHVFPEQDEGFTHPLSVVLIDQFEAITNTVPDIKEVQSMMHNVAVDIPILKNYAVLATTSNLETYLEMLTWNGGQKFTAVVEGGFIWTQEELQHVVDTYQRKGFISPATATQASMKALQEAMKNMTTITHLRLYMESHFLVDFNIPPPRALVQGEL